MMPGKFSAAVIGCGRIGAQFDADPRRKYIATHAGAYSAVRGVELTAVCDLDIAKAAACAARRGCGHYYRDIGQMLRAHRIDMVSICTPAASHYAVLKEIAQYPVRAVFCEKPMAHTLSAARKMRELCVKKNIILQIGHQRRFDPLHERIRACIRAKELGKVQQVNFYYTAGINNTGSHMFDLLRYFFGDAEWVEAFVSGNAPAKADDPNLDGIIRFKNGIFATFQACDSAKYLIFELNFLCDRGRVILKQSGFEVECYTTAQNRYFSGYRELTPARPFFKTRYRRNSLVNAVEHLVCCLNRGRESVSSGLDGVKAVELIEHSLSSAARGGRRIYMESR